MERPQVRRDAQRRRLPDPQDARRPVLEPDPLRRAGGGRRPQVAHAQGPVHALRRAGLPGGLPRAGRDRPVRERHRGRQPGAVHRLRLLRDRLPLRRAEVPRVDGKDGQVHALRGPRLGRPRARVHQGLPDGVPPLRNEGRHDRARQPSRGAAQGQRLPARRSLRPQGRRRHRRRHGARVRRPPRVVRRPAARPARTAGQSGSGRTSSVRSDSSPSSGPSSAPSGTTSTSARRKCKARRTPNPTFRRREGREKRRQHELCPDPRPGDGRSRHRGP